MNDSPCYKCQERYTGCHSKCERYSKWKKQQEELREKIQKERDFDTWHKKQILSRLGRMNNRGR